MKILNKHLVQHLIKILVKYTSGKSLKNYFVKRLVEEFSWEEILYSGHLWGKNELENKLCHLLEISYRGDSISTSVMSKSSGKNILISLL